MAAFIRHLFRKSGNENYLNFNRKTMVGDHRFELWTR